tara:strand:- start:262 stop:600 length:339 start_codon:yes stop_codon:yes gene_type:complete
MIKLYSVINTETGKVLRHLQCLETDSALNVYDGESLVEGIISAEIEDSTFQTLRTIRGILLSSSDWTQFPDSPLTTAKKTEWATYRQALRDAPETYSDATSLDAIIWPTKPR